MKSTACLSFQGKHKLNTFSKQVRNYNATFLFFAPAPLFKVSNVFEHWYSFLAKQHIPAALINDSEENKTNQSRLHWFNWEKT